MRWIFCIAIVLAQVAASAADSTDEAAVRKIDDEERVAVLKEDIAALTDLWAADLVVHNPQNRISDGREAVFERMRQGLIRYSKFERTTDLVRIDGDIAFVMGGETVVPKSDSKSETLHRRYTNVWKRSGGKWVLIARQSTIISRE